MKYLILSIFFSLSFLTFSQNNNEFTSAEERIVYNKKNNLNKYTGIDISYTYELNLNSEVPAESLKKIGHHFFKNIIDVQFFEENNKKYVAYLTEGSLGNNEISREIPAQLNNEFIFAKRTYHLK